MGQTISSQRVAIANLMRGPAQQRSLQWRCYERSRCRIPAKNRGVALPIVFPFVTDRNAVIERFPMRIFLRIDLKERRGYIMNSVRRINFLSAKQ
jgi:hypothetical protein